MGQHWLLIEFVCPRGAVEEHRVSCRRFNRVHIDPNPVKLVHTMGLKGLRHAVLTCRNAEIIEFV